MEYKKISRYLSGDAERGAERTPSFGRRRFLTTVAGAGALIALLGVGSPAAQERVSVGASNPWGEQQAMQAQAGKHPVLSGKVIKRKEIYPFLDGGKSPPEVRAPFKIPSSESATPAWSVHDPPEGRPKAEEWGQKYVAANVDSYEITLKRAEAGTVVSVKHSLRGETGSFLVPVSIEKMNISFIPRKEFAGVGLLLFGDQAHTTIVYQNDEYTPPRAISLTGDEELHAEARADCKPIIGFKETEFGLIVMSIPQITENGGIVKIFQFSPDGTVSTAMRPFKLAGVIPA